MSPIIPQDPPVDTRRAHALMPLDRDILDVAVIGMRPSQIRERLLGKHPGITTQRVFARLKALLAKDLLLRIRPVDGPINGPGSSLYRARRPEDA